MKVLEVTHSDLPGHIFNGYDLHIVLRKQGYDVRQMVKKKYGDCDTVKSFCNDEFCLSQLVEWEKEHSVSHVMIPFGHELLESVEFQEAEIVHYHILHNHSVSLFDYAELMNKKCSVWTIHDAWIITGNCIQPADCTKWLSGCGNCPSLKGGPFRLEEDNTDFMWNLKKHILSQVNPDIVVASEFMRQCIKRSPITGHFDRIHTIPFGVDIGKYDISNKSSKKQKFQVSLDNILIGFRADDLYIKGCSFLYEALEKIEGRSKVTLICAGEGTVPRGIKDKYRVIELGWMYDAGKVIDFLEAVDIFVMPSLAEGFGLMAIEAMAAGCAVICFRDTVLEEITNAPSCGVAVEYKSSNALAEAMQKLIDNRQEAEMRGRLGHELARKRYQFKDYVERHKMLYEQLYDNYYKT